MASQKFKVYDKGLELNLNVLSEARWLKGKIGEWLAEKYLRELFPDLHIYPLTSELERSDLLPLVKLRKEYPEILEKIIGGPPRGPGPSTFDFLGLKVTPARAWDYYIRNHQFIYYVSKEVKDKIFNSLEEAEKIIGPIRFEEKCLIDIKSTSYSTKYFTPSFSPNQKEVIPICLKASFKIFIVTISLHAKLERENKNLRNYILNEALKRS